MRVQELLEPRAASAHQILESCEHALNVQDAGDLDFDVSGAQIISSLLSKLSVSKEGSAFHRLTAAALIARLVHSAGKKKADVAKALLQSNYTSSLCLLTSASVAAAREAEIPLEQSCMNISDLLKAIDDAGMLSYKDPTATAAILLDGGGGGSNRVRGRAIIGQDAVPALLDVIFLINDVQDDDISYVVRSCTLSTESLAILVHGSVPNGQAMALAPQLDNGKSLSTLLQRSGSFSLQFDISEIFYHYFVIAEQVKNDPGYQGTAFPELEDFPLSAPLKKLASMDMQEMNFPEELRNIVMNYNRTLKAASRVTSLSAKGIVIAGYNTTMPSGNYVDFGTISLTLTLLLDSTSPTASTKKNNTTTANNNNSVFSQEETFGSQSQPDEFVSATNTGSTPAIEEIFYSDMNGAKFTRGQNNGTTMMSISLPRLSQDLLNAGYGSVEDDTHHIVIKFDSQELEGVFRAAPEVVKAMESAGIAWTSLRGRGGDAIGGGAGAPDEADASQRPKKVSIAVAPRMVAPRINNVSGLRKDTVFVQMNRIKQNNTATTTGITDVSRNAPPPSAAPAAAPIPAPLEKAQSPAQKRQWNRTKRAEEDGQAKPAAEEAKNKAAAATGKKKVAAAEKSEKKEGDVEKKAVAATATTTAKKADHNKNPTAAATKQAAAAAAPKPKKTHRATATAATSVEEGDPIENTELPSTVVITEEDRPVLEGVALPDWMQEAAPAMSPAFKSQYVASPQQRASPYYDSSDDEDDEFVMNQAYAKAAADEKAVVGGTAKKAAAAKKEWTPGNNNDYDNQQQLDDPFAYVDHETKTVKEGPKKSKLVAAAQKPRAVATKRRSAATKKKPTTAAAPSPAGKKKQPATKNKKPTTDPIATNGGRRQPRRAAAAQAATKTKRQLNSQSIDLKDDHGTDSDDELGTNNSPAAGGGGGNGNGGIYSQGYSDDGWGPATQIPPSRMLLEDNNSSDDEGVGGEGAGGAGDTDDDIDLMLANEYAGIYENMFRSSTRRTGKNSLAGNTAATTATAAADVLRKRVSSPSSGVKKGKGRLSKMLPAGGGNGTGDKGAQKKKAQPVGQDPANKFLETETPAADVGKKRDAISSEKPKTKPAAAAKSAAQKQRPGAGAKQTFGAKKKGPGAVVQLQSNTTSEDEEDNEAHVDVFNVAEKQQKRAPAPVAAAAAAAAKKKTPAATAGAKTTKTPTAKKKSAATVWDDIDKEQLLKEEEEHEEFVEKPAARTAAAKKTNATTAAAIQKKNKAVNFETDFSLSEPDEDFEIHLDSDSEYDDYEEEEAPAVVARSTGGTRKKKKPTAGGADCGGNAAVLLQMLQGRLGGPTASLDSEDDGDLDEDDDDDGLGSSGFAHVQAAIAQAVANRNRKAQRARAAQVKKLEKEIKAELDSAQNEVTADVAAAEAKAAEALAVVESKLVETEDEIRAVQAEYEVKLSELSEKQRALAVESERVGQEAARHVAEAKNRGKRKLHEAFAAVKVKLEEGKRRIQRAAKRAKRMPDLASLLVPLFASG